MTVRTNAQRSASTALSATLACWLAASMPALAAPLSEGPPPKVKTATVEPAATGKNDMLDVPEGGTSTSPPGTSDYKAPEPEEPTSTTVAPVVPRDVADAVGTELLARLKDKKPLLPRFSAKEQESVLAFYNLVDFKSAWIRDGAFTPAAESVIARLRAAGEDGLDPKAYPVPTLPGSGEKPTDKQIAEADIALSAAVAAYARDARGGRINYATISRLITPKLDLPAPDLVLGQLWVSDSEAGQRLQAYNPQTWGYGQLKARLATLRGVTPIATTETPEAPKSLQLPAGPTLSVGMKDARVPKLRAFFNLPENPPGTLDAAPGEAELFDQSVSDAISRFQTDHHLAVDGRLNRQTVVALATPPRHTETPAASGSGTRGNEADLIVNMERWRWLPSDLGTDYVLVNVPEFRLRAYRGGHIANESRVIVGKPETPTPLFSGEMEYAVVNPSWYVPPSILKTMKGTGGFEVIGRGKNIGLRQPPGPRNALGYVKMMFPNQHSVYLHDTPARHLFSAPKRAFSHGCVRVDNPFKLASVALSGYSEQGLRKMIGHGERTIKLEKLLPVHIDYFTAYVDDDGVYRTLPDLYGYDPKMKAALGLSGAPSAMVSLPREPKREAATTGPVAADAPAGGYRKVWRNGRYVYVKAPGAVAAATPPDNEPAAADAPRIAPRVAPPQSIELARPSRPAVRAVRREASPAGRSRSRRYGGEYGEPSLWTPAPTRPSGGGSFWW